MSRHCSDIASRNENVQMLTRKGDVPIVILRRLGRQLLNIPQPMINCSSLMANGRVARNAPLASVTIRMEKARRQTTPK